MSCLLIMVSGCVPLYFIWNSLKIGVLYLKYHIVGNCLYPLYKRSSACKMFELSYTLIRLYNSFCPVKITCQISMVSANIFSFPAYISISQPQSVVVSIFELHVSWTYHQGSNRGVWLGALLLWLLF